VATIHTVHNSAEIGRLVSYTVLSYWTDHHWTSVYILRPICQQSNSGVH